MMRGLIKATNAASTDAARTDFNRLRAVALSYGVGDLVPSLPTGAGWRRLDAMAKIAVGRILDQQPAARDELAAIYPDFVPVEAAGE